jgi:hypothetical protein
MIIADADINFKKIIVKYTRKVMRVSKEMGISIKDRYGI